MKRGFTLVELLAVIVILGIIAVITTPAISEGIKTNSEKALEIQKKRIIDAAEDWSLEHLSLLPKDNNGEYRVKLSELKKGYISINVKNPDTGRILSDESYVIITNNNSDYKYDVKLYDIPDELLSGNVTFPLEATGTSELTIGSSIIVNDITVSIIKEDGTSENRKCSKQYILNNNEVNKIDTSKKGTYSIVYTVLHEEKIYKSVKTIIVK